MVEAGLTILYITLLYNTLHHIVLKCFTLKPPQWSGVARAGLPTDLGPNRSAQHWKRSQQQFVCLSHALSMVYILQYFRYKRFVQPVHCATFHNTLKNISINCDTLCSFSVNLTIPNDSLSVSHCSVTHPTPALVCISQIGKKDPWNISELNEIWEEICFCQTLFRRLLVITYEPKEWSTISVNAFRMTSHNNRAFFISWRKGSRWTNAKIELIRYL